MRSVIGYGVLAPPAIFIVLCLLGAAVALVWWRIGITVVLVASICLFAAATPAVSSLLLVWLESRVQQGTNLTSAQAIVILGADLRPDDAATPDRLGPQTLERLFFAVDAYKQYHLPIAVSGGPAAKSQPPLAEIMRSALERYFSIPVTWSECRSRNTYENAAYTARMLQNADIRTVILITQARDAPRAIWSFQRVGLIALPWTSPRAELKTNRIRDFLPSISALDESFYTFHELIGTLYYRMRY